MLSKLTTVNTFFRHMLDGLIRRYTLSSRKATVFAAAESIALRKELEEKGFIYKYLNSDKSFEVKWYYWKPGDGLTNQDGHNGTIGMYADVENKEYKFVAISHDHVAQKGSIVTLTETGQTLGQCIWGKLSVVQDNLYDVSVIKVDNEHVARSLSNVNKRQVELYRENLENVLHLKVKKRGYTTKETSGRVTKVARQRDDDDTVCGEIIVVRGDDDDDHPFALKGDSGSVIFHPMSSKLSAISSLVGECTDVETSSTSSEDSKPDVASQASGCESEIRADRTSDDRTDTKTDPNVTYFVRKIPPRKDDGSASPKGASGQGFPDDTSADVQTEPSTSQPSSDDKQQQTDKKPSSETDPSSCLPEMQSEAAAIVKRKRKSVLSVPLHPAIQRFNNENPDNLKIKTHQGLYLEDS